MNFPTTNKSDHSTGSMAKKKAKTEEATAADATTLAFAAVREHLLQFRPPPDAAAPPEAYPAALQAALDGLDQKEQQLERDRKLQQKFAAAAPAASAGSAVSSMSDVVQVEKPVLSEEFKEPKQHSGDSQQEEEDMMMMMPDNDDWHNVAPSEQSPSGRHTPPSWLGQRLSQQVIACMAQAQPSQSPSSSGQAITVPTPLAAVAVALHAALVSDTMRFSCTGVPSSDKATGFAAPVRDLPRGQFLPPHCWEQQPSESLIRLRYRKAHTGSMILQLEQKQEPTEAATTTAAAVPMIQVSLRSETEEPPPTVTEEEALNFALSDFINLDSFARAQQQEGGGNIAPALHYKSLATLLTRFAQTFDLGAVCDNDDEEGKAAAETSALPYVDTTIQRPPPAGTTTFVPDRPPPPEPQPHRPWLDERTPPTIDSAFPGLRHPRGMPGGDFAGDLAPGGIVGPHFDSTGQGGMVMGPNHPAFGSVGVGGGRSIGPDSGLGMRPRFDPFGPPGGPTEDPNKNDGQPQPPPHRGPRKDPPGGPGDPNPDHQRPPNDLSHNMFS